jgi:hypothetical protein
MAKSRGFAYFKVVIILGVLQIDDTGRKVVFPNIKNKFRFVTVSLLLGSLVTLISSASAEESDPLPFSIDVTSCTDGGFPAYWAPSIDPAEASKEVAAGTTGSITALTGFNDGFTYCDDGSRNVSGTVNSTLTITGGEMWMPSIDCFGGCDANNDLVPSGVLESVTGTYDVPVDEDSGNYPGTITLTWTPGGSPS